ncbi:MAG: hypothetical protein HHJ12_08515 [Glaciimonas sp.]|nr:hypothetical protein [Glaciimonas sp.]
MENDFLDRSGWQTMLDREQMPDASACIGVLRRNEFVARLGTLLIWYGKAGGIQAAFRDYHGDAGSDLAVLLVADEDAVQTLLARGLTSIPALVRAGRLHPYILKTLDELESAGLADFVEDMGLTFPKH